MEIYNNSLALGGTITGDLTVTGDLGVNGNLNFGDASVDTLTSQGAIIIDTDLAEAFLVRRDGDAGDVFAIDTNSSIVAVTGAQTVSGNLDVAGLVALGGGAAIVTTRILNIIHDFGEANVNVVGLFVAPQVEETTAPTGQIVQGIVGQP